MAQKAETKFKLKVYAALDELPGVWYTKIQQVALRGIPDILGCCGGYLIAFELKVGNNKADPLQQWTLKQIEEAGGIARVVTPDNLDDVIQELRNV